MRIKPGETLEDWAYRVQQYEYGYALQRLAQGEDVNLVMEAMTERIKQKILHPIVTAIKDSKKTGYDPEESRKAYEENYLKRYGPKPDHIND